MHVFDHVWWSLRRLWRQRRRLVLGGVLFAFGAFQPVVPWGESATLKAAAAVAGFTLLAALIVLILPASRWVILRLGFAVAATASMSWAWPTLYAPLSLALVFLGFALLPGALGPVRRLRLGVIQRGRARRHFRLAPETMWRYLFPRSGRTHWDSAVMRVTQVAGKENEFEISTGGNLRRIAVFDIEPPGHFKTRSLDGDGGQVTVTSHVLSATRRGTELIVMEATWRPRLGEMVDLWLDDYLRDHLDRMQGAIEGTPDPSIRTALFRRLG